MTRTSASRRRTTSRVASSRSMCSSERARSRREPRRSTPRRSRSAWSTSAPRNVRPRRTRPLRKRDLSARSPTTSSATPISNAHLRARVPDRRSARSRAAREPAPQAQGRRDVRRSRRWMRARHRVRHRLDVCGRRHRRDCAKHYDCVPGAWCNNGTCVAAPGRRSLQQPPRDGETRCVGLMRPVAPATCRRVTHVGDTCDWFCLGNLYCDLPATGFGVCKPIPVHNEACSAQLPCLGVDQRCAGQCIDRSTVGQSCTDGTCQPELFCSDQVAAANPICTARLGDATSGCNQPAQCQSYVCDGGVSAIGNCQALQTTCP